MDRRDDLWSEIDAIFTAALDCPSRDRERFVEKACANDPELKEAVDSLLKSCARAASFLEKPIFSLTRGVHLSHVSAAQDEGVSPADGHLENDSEKCVLATRDPLGLTGQRVSHFTVERMLGIGGMGIVYRGTDLRLGRSVALKFLLPESSLDPGAKQRFLLEGRAASLLDHPNVCTVHEAGETEDGRPFLAMTCYPGETLQAHLKRRGALPLGEAIALAGQIGRGLSAAHAAGVVHGDLKTGNLILTADGTLKILDFGLARVRDGTSGTVQHAGTVAYMSPEQLRGNPVDGRSDLWSMGVVLYEMLTGEVPFGGRHELSTIRRILCEEPPSLRGARSDVSDGLEEIVIRSLRKDPAERWDTAEAVTRALDNFSHAAPQLARGAATMPLLRGSTWHRLGGRAAGRVATLTLVAAGLVLLIPGVPTQVASRIRPDPPRGDPMTEAQLAAGSARPSQAFDSSPQSAPRSRSPNNLEAYTLLIRALDASGGNADVRLDMLRRARELDPGFYDTHLALSRLFLGRYQSLGRREWLDSAAVAARRAIEIEPNLPEGHEQLGWALDRSGELEAALRAHQRAVELDPSYSAGLANLYTFGLGRLDEGARWFVRAVQSDPTDNVYQHVAGWTFLQLGMPERARIHFEKAIEFRPASWVPHYWLAVMLVQEGRQTEAWEYAERILEASGAGANELLIAAEIALYLGDLPTSRRHYEQGIAARPSNWQSAHAMLTLGWILQQMGEVEQADALVSDAAAVFAERWGGEPNRPEDFEDLAKILLLRGDRQGALEQFELAIHRGRHSFYDRPLHPILQALSGDPRFERLRAEMKANADRQRARLEREGW